MFCEVLHEFVLYHDSISTLVQLLQDDHQILH